MSICRPSAQSVEKIFQKKPFSLGTVRTLDSTTMVVLVPYLFVFVTILCSGAVSAIYIL